MGSFRVEKDRGRELCSTTQASDTMGTGFMIRGMARLMRSLLTGVSFRVNIDRTRCMGKGSTVIRMDRPTMENGKITSNMELVSGSVQKATRILESGKMEQPQVLGCSRRTMPVVIKVLFCLSSSMEKEQKNLPQETSIKAIIKMENFMVLDSTTGKTAVFIRESLWRAKSMVMGCGEREILMKNMKENLCRIERKDTASTLGITEMFIREATITTSGKERERCIGVMELSTKELGWSTNPMEKGVFLMGWKSLRAFSRMARWSITISLRRREEESASSTWMGKLPKEWSGLLLER